MTIVIASLLIGIPAGMLIAVCILAILIHVNWR
jgi:hypothetical protein